MSGDRELVERVLAGDARSFAELVRRYQRLVGHMVVRVIKDERDREELCQDVFVRVYQKLGGFRFDAKLSSWIARIAWNTCLNHLQRKKQPTDSAEHDPGIGEGVLARIPGRAVSQLGEVERADARAMVRREVERLPAAYRAAVTLFHLEEMTLAEISQALELPEGTVKSHLFRARQILKERLLDHYSRAELSP